MRHLRIAAFAALILSPCLPMQAAAQDDPQDNALHPMIGAIEDYLSKPPGARGVLRLDPDMPVVIDDRLKTALRFRFQQRMALSGHGVLFDIEGREVKLDDAEIPELLAEMLDVVRAEAPDAKLPDEAQAQLDKIIDEGRTLLRRTDDPVRRQLVQAELIRALAQRLSDDRRAGYEWRVVYLSNVIRRRFEIPRDLVILPSLRGWIIDWVLRTDYMRHCTAAGVPVPPDFALSGTPWRQQGQLGTKLISSGIDATVWTWNGSGRGACVALPRGDGPGDVSGIICQSATTGNACFWDNLPRGGTTRIDWSSETLDISELQDGSNLAENCTNCHQGNNVFLLSTDDPTWCKLLRGSSSGTPCGAVTGPGSAGFTLAVEAPVRTVNVPNTSIQHSRYTPMSGTPARPGWVNNETVGCGGVCHLGSGGPFGPPPMPPACGTDCY